MDMREHLGDEALKAASQGREQAERNCRKRERQVRLALCGPLAVLPDHKHKCQVSRTVRFEPGHHTRCLSGISSR